jgi:hypothetical protein
LQWNLVLSDPVLATVVGVAGAKDVPSHLETTASIMAQEEEEEEGGQTCEEVEAARGRRLEEVEEDNMGGKEEGEEGGPGLRDRAVVMEAVTIQVEGEEEEEDLTSIGGGTKKTTPFSLSLPLGRRPVGFGCC